MYFGFNPFSQSYQMYGNSNLFLSNYETHNMPTDMLGFIINIYALATEWDFKDVLVPPMPDCNKFLAMKYKKYRTRRYYKKFNNIKSKKVWGCDSPIELFLLQAMSKEKLSPLIQASIFEDGSVYPGLHEILNDNQMEDELEQITDADFYFPDSKLAIFCDSNSFHRTKKAKEKDIKIDKKLKDLGIHRLRIMGTDIINEPFKCVKRIQEYL